MVERKRTQDIRTFLVLNVREHPKDIVKVTTNEFNISRQAVNRHIHALVNKGFLKASGNTKARKYELVPLMRKSFKYIVDDTLEEHKVWREIIKFIDEQTLPKNTMEICEYGVNEMVNNVVDHSEGTSLEIIMILDIDRITFWVEDDGIGIFDKIQKEFNLEEGDLFNPRINIKTGMYIFDHYRRFFGGDIDLAIVAYWQGPQKTMQEIDFGTIDDNKYLNSIEKAVSFYKQNQFYTDGRAKWRLPYSYPIDIHQQAQGIITFCKIYSLFADESYLDFSKIIAKWTIKNMYDPKGFFYYQKWPIFTNKNSYMRWNQAWIMLALSCLLNEIKYKKG